MNKYLKKLKEQAKWKSEPQEEGANEATTLQQNTQKPEELTQCINPYGIEEAMWLDEELDKDYWRAITPQMLIAEDGLPTTGYLRLSAVLTIIPVSKSTLYKWISEGKFPRPTDKFGPKIAAWHVDDIRAKINK